MTGMVTTGSALVEMFTHPFMRDAFLAGTGIGLAAGPVGYFLVLRAQVFTADALSHVAVTGAFAALLLGLDLRLGLVVITVALAVGMGAMGRRARPDDVVIGGAFAWILGLGVFLLTLYTTSRSAGNGAATVEVLFGSVFGLDAATAQLAAVIGAIICVATLVLCRPLLFSSLDPDMAAARGVPVRALGFGFLALVAATVAEATPVVGALLVLGLVAAPAGAATRLTTRPYPAMLLSTLIAVGSLWLGLTLSYLIPTLPPSFAILAIASGALVAALITEHLRRHHSPRTHTGTGHAEVVIAEAHRPT